MAGPHDPNAGQYDATAAPHDPNVGQYDATAAMPSAEPSGADDLWVHRATNMRCHKCMYYVKKHSAGPNLSVEIGRCRRRAPTMNGWPVMYPHDWCGDHKLDETK